VLLSKQESNLAGVVPGDLICVDWFDASIGKSRVNSCGGIDVPVKSVGIFVLVAKNKKPTILLAQNCFEYGDGFFDVDYTAIPAAWNSEIKVLVKGFISAEKAAVLAESFMLTKNQVKRSSEPRALLHRQQHLRHCLGRRRRKF
jgi:hypothetical protein